MGMHDDFGENQFICESRQKVCDSICSLMYEVRRKFLRTEIHHNLFSGIEGKREPH